MQTLNIIVPWIVLWILSVYLGRALSEIFGKLHDVVEALQSIRFALGDLNQSIQQLVQQATDINRRNF